MPFPILVGAALPAVATPAVAAITKTTLTTLLIGIPVGLVSLAALITQLKKTPQSEQSQTTQEIIAEAAHLRSHLSADVQTLIAQTGDAVVEERHQGQQDMVDLASVIQRLGVTVGQISEQASQFGEGLESISGSSIRLGRVLEDLQSIQTALYNDITGEQAQLKAMFTPLMQLTVLLRSRIQTLEAALQTRTDQRDRVLLLLEDVNRKNKLLEEAMQKHVSAQASVRASSGCQGERNDTVTNCVF